MLTKDSSLVINGRVNLNPTILFVRKVTQELNTQRAQVNWLGGSLH